jgi:hypothetical protein
VYSTVRLKAPQSPVSEWAQSPPCAVDVRTCLPSSLVTHHLLLPIDFLTATFAKLEIESTHSKHRTSHFSNRNKNGLSSFQTFSAPLGVSGVNLPWKRCARIEFQS